MASAPERPAKFLGTALCAAFALLTAIVPFTRAFFRLEVNYNEGWNVYNAAMEAANRQLYPATTGWTAINYPMLSFVLVAQLHRWTHDYLFTARVLSLIALCISCLLVAAIVRRLTEAWRPALLAGFFCLALFSVAADYPAYVGVDDPQMLAHAFYLAGLWIYLKLNRSCAGVAFSALLFVLAFSIKHNPIEIPLAVFLDLLFISRRRAVGFVGCGLAFLAAAIALQLHFGGPNFIANLLAPRTYSVEKAFELAGVYLGPLVLPLAAGLYAAYLFRRDPRRRIAAILLPLSLLLGGYFIGGDGVSINAFFGAYFAMSIMLGLFLWRCAESPFRWAIYAPGALFAWLLIPWLVVPPLDERAAAQLNWNPPLALEQAMAAEARFDEEVAFLRGQPGLALCESLLRCYYAGKPYVYDPYNATRMIGLGQLDASVLIDELRQQKYGAIQLNGRLDDPRRTEMFAPTILAAIRQNYQPVLENQDGAIYLPNAAVAAREAAQARDAAVVKITGKKS